MCYNRNIVLNTIQHIQILSVKLEGREGMEKGQLMEYLSAVCDAENALYACNEAIAQLQAKLQKTHPVYKRPVKLSITPSEVYQRDLMLYENYKNSVEAVRKEIEGAIQTNVFVAERIKQELQQLYSRDVLHVSFRNMVAVNQIREYLDMGVCDALEGPTGAYSQYLQDVRVNRICTSIDELKRSLLHALNQIAMNQSILVSEMRKMNENINQMQASIDQGFAGIQQQMNRAQQMAAVQTSQLENRFAEMNTQLEGIHNALSASAHNEYVALRETNVRRYLKKYQLPESQLY